MWSRVSWWSFLSLRVFSRREREGRAEKPRGHPRFCSFREGHVRETRKRKNLWIDAGARPAITKRQCLRKLREQERHSSHDRRSRMLRCVMNRKLTVGIAGHQKRRGLDWNWVNATLRAELVALGGVSRALSSLAAGADQRFATVALELNIPVTAVLPMSGYGRFLRGKD